MAERLEITNQEDLELRKQLEKINWPIYYGNVKIQIRAGKVTFVTLERTIRLD